MNNFSTRELGEMIYVYGEARGSAFQARRIYAQRFPSRNCPSARFFQRLYIRLLETGSLNSARDSATNVSNDTSLDERILEMVEENPSLSVRRIARQIGVSKSAVWRVLRRERLHPYHFTRVHEILPPDALRRISFCEMILEKSARDSLFLRKILWSDEARFDRQGIVNLHNWHTWAERNPRNIRQVNVQYRFGFTAWAGVIDSHLIGPYIFEEHITSESYLRFLQNTLPDLLENIPLNLRRGMIFQQDGAPPHSSRVVKQWLDENFNRRWIGRGGPMEWPPRSPDLTPMDYFVWGFLKDIVYSEDIATLDQLKRRFYEACARLRHVLRSTDIPRSVVRRAHICLLEDGEHIENVL